MTIYFVSKVPVLKNGKRKASSELHYYAIEKLKSRTKENIIITLANMKHPHRTEENNQDQAGKENRHRRRTFSTWRLNRQSYLRRKHNLQLNNKWSVQEHN